MTSWSADLKLVFSLALFAWSACTSQARADTVELHLSTPPHPPSDAPDAVVHVPTHYDPRAPLHVVIFLHGFSCCTRALVADEDTACAAGAGSAHGFRLAALHEAAASSTILIVPQLAFLARDARAPRFERPGGLDELLVAALRDGLAKAPGGPRTLAELTRVTLVAHSGGYRAAADILRDLASRAPVTDVVLLDALYAEVAAFAGFVERAPNNLLLSLYTHDRRTQAQNARLVRALGAARGERVKEALLLQGLSRGRARVSEVEVPHRALPERYFAELVRALSALPASTP